MDEAITKQERKLALMDAESSLRRVARQINSLKDMKEMRGGDTFIEDEALKNTYDALMTIKALLEGGEIMYDQRLER